MFFVEYKNYTTNNQKNTHNFRENILYAIASELEFFANNTLSEMLKRGMDFKHE